MRASAVGSCPGRRVWVMGQAGVGVEGALTPKVSERLRVRKASGSVPSVVPEVHLS